MLDMLDVVIGVIFLYLVMSLVASAAVELLEVLLQYRSRDLARGIRELVHDNAVFADIYRHPLVSSLYKGGIGDSGVAAILLPWVERLRGRWLGRKLEQLAWWFATRKLPSYVPARNFSLALMDVLDVPTTNATPANPATAREPIRLPAEFANPDQVRKAVSTLVSAAGQDAAKARENIEEWFNTSMDRVSGWYKRRTHLFLALIGLLAAAYFNVDSIQVTMRLARDKQLREATVAAATEYAKADAKAITETTPPANRAEAEKKLQAATAKLESLGLPIGWKGQRPPKTADDWLAKILGILITAAAVSLGAPFWFDLLNKIIVVRSTVKPKEKSGVEGAKEPQAPR